MEIQETNAIQCTMDEFLHNQPTEEDRSAEVERDPEETLLRIRLKEGNPGLGSDPESIREKADSSAPGISGLQREDLPVGTMWNEAKATDENLPPYRNQERTGGDRDAIEECRHYVTEHPSVKVFPVNCLNPIQSEIVHDFSALSGIPQDLIASMLLGIVSFLLQGRFRIEIDLMNEPMSMFMCLVDPSGNHKLAMEFLICPLLHRAQSDAGKLPGAIIDGSSMEGVIRQLFYHQGSVAAFSCLGGFLNDPTSKKSLASAMTLAAAHDGFHLSTSDRKRCLHLMQPKVTLVFSGDAGILGITASKENTLRELADRMLYVVTEGKERNRGLTGAPELSAIQEKYEHELLSLINIPVSGTLQLSKAATEKYNDYVSRIDGGLTADMNALRGWVNNLGRHVIRFAGILHVSQYKADALSIPIDADAIQRAILIADYYFQHARRAFGVSDVQQTQDNIRYLAGRLAELPGSEITLKALNEKTKNRLKGVARLRKTLNILEADGIVEVEARANGGTGRQSQIVHVDHLKLTRFLKEKFKSR